MTTIIEEPEGQPLKRPTLLQALLPLFFLIGFLTVNVVLVFGNDSLSGANQMALLFAAGAACIVAANLGMRWPRMLDGMVSSINSALPSIFILLLIGSLSSAWLLSGVVPAMIYYGLQILNPTIFLVASCIICGIISVATGSSWTTVATIGVALLAIGKTLGIGEGIVAGAIISGAYFGDKISPLSDTTNLAPAMAGTDLFTHIRYMLYTTIPSISITLIIFLVIGFGYSGETDTALVASVTDAIQSKFNITPWLFLVPLIVVVLIVRKVPAIPALFVGTLLGLLFAGVFQSELINRLANADDLLISKAKVEASISEAEKTAAVSSFISENQPIVYFTIMMKNLYTDTSITTGNDIIDKEGLLSSSGMKGMLSTVWLIICAMIFGGVMESSGLLARMTEGIVRMAKSTGSLIAATATTCLVFNITASDQYLAIVVPGRMFMRTFRERGLKPENLSRTLEDAGTVTSVLIPWNTCGAYQSSVLGVATGDYFFYCFFNIISPIMTMIFGFFNIKIRKIESEN